MAQVIGIDIGGTKINTLVTNNLGDELYCQTTQTPNGQQEVLRSIKETINNVLNNYNQIEAIGIGTPGYINANLGKVIYSSGIIADWVDVPLRQLLEATFNLPVVIDNDANAAAVGEGWLGVASLMDDYMVITLGTSVGGSYINGKFGILHGYGWRGGEIGHSILYPEGRLCLCGQSGCVDQYLSGPAITNHYLQLGGIANSARDVFAALKNNDCHALAVKNSFVKNLATLLISLQNILDPEAFIISGGLINSRQWWWDDLQSCLQKKSNKGVDIKILPAKLANYAGAFGAARLALNLLEA